MAQQAVANHVVYTADLRRPTELGAQQRDDLARWVSNRLNHQVAPPDLSADGYSYMGGRLAATPDGPAGMFMYDGPKGVRLTVFVLPLARPRPCRSSTSTSPRSMAARGSTRASATPWSASCRAEVCATSPRWYASN